MRVPVAVGEGGGGKRGRGERGQEGVKRAMPAPVSPAMAHSWLAVVAPSGQQQARRRHPQAPHHSPGSMGQREAASRSMWGPLWIPDLLVLANPWPSLALPWPSLGRLLGSWGADLALAGSENKLRRGPHPSPISRPLLAPSWLPFRPMMWLSTAHTPAPTHLDKRKRFHRSSGRALHSHPTISISNPQCRGGPP